MRKILVVEDARSLRRDIVEMLSYEGFDVRGAENGLHGVQFARSYAPDLIICDIMMPEMDGFEVLQELRKEKTTATIPFIFLTARTERPDFRYGMELGADDYLTKPFTASELLSTVHARLEKLEVLNNQAQRTMKDLRENIILALPHELRTPLTGILGFSDILMADATMMEPEQIGDMARHINEAALRLYRLVENYLAYAQLEIILSDDERMAAIRQLTFSKPKTNIEMYALNRASDSGREDDLVLVTEDAAEVFVSEDNLKKIMEELLDNAFKFSVKGQKVTVSSFIENDSYVLRVRDEGRGMSPEARKEIGAYMQFGRKFYEQQGSGMGLIIAKRLAEMHGGDLDIESNLEDGTTVTVYFPVLGGDQA